MRTESLCIVNISRMMCKNMKISCYIENTKIAGGFFGGFSYVTFFLNVLCL